MLKSANRYTFPCHTRLDVAGFSFRSDFHAISPFITPQKEARIPSMPFCHYFITFTENCLFARYALLATKNFRHSMDRANDTHENTREIPIFTFPIWVENYYSRHPSTAFVTRSTGFPNLGLKPKLRIKPRHATHETDLGFAWFLTSRRNLPRYQ